MTKLNFFVLLGILLLSGVSFGQTKLKSTVVDQYSEPIIGATILIQNDSTNLGPGVPRNVFLNATYRF